MASEDSKILKFNLFQKSDKTSFIINADHQSLIENMDRCKNNSGKLPTTKLGKHISFRFFNVYNIVI